MLEDTTPAISNPPPETATGPDSKFLPPPEKKSIGGSGTTLAPSVPIRSSSATGTTQMNDQTGTNPVPLTNKGSKDKASGGTAIGAGANTSRETPTGETTTGESGRGAETAKPRRKGGFLSFLNCCSAKDNDNAVELRDQIVPVKKTKGAEQNQGRQPTPALGKPNASAAESSVGELKETPGDGIGGPEYSELKGGSEPMMETQPSVEPTKPQISSTDNTTDLPIPPPKTTLLSNAEPEQNQNPSSTTQSAITNAAEPPQLVEPEESVAVQGTAINDRTLQQETQDHDVAMPDAPPVAPMVPEGSARQPPQQDYAQTQMNLPPPPPRNGINPTPAADTSSALVTKDREVPKWLLPPLSPRLAGRKCLVLDLDETLVHSSFKVCDLLVNE